MSVSTDSLDVTEVAEHSLLPVPDSARTSTAAHQFWIWTGANIAPINWVLGALGIAARPQPVADHRRARGRQRPGHGGLRVLRPHGPAHGREPDGAVAVAYGRRGAYLPAAMQGLLAAGWCAVNTWIVLDLVVACSARSASTAGRA